MSMSMKRRNLQIGISNVDCTWTSCDCHNQECEVLKDDNDELLQALMDSILTLVDDVEHTDIKTS